MLKFKSFLLEYLTDEQRERYKHVEMTDKARTDTDHFFGKDNDIVHGSLHSMTDKSEIHKKVENHLNKELSHDEYRSGLTTDNYGRSARIGRMIKDKSLQDEFARDPVREGSRSAQTQYTTSTARGIHVAGQTNPVPNEQHPKGHSWAEISCKNVETGMHKRRLVSEIQHGSVVHFVHDKNGQEIYRASVQPHHNEWGHTVYAVDAEYGIKHPEFTKDAHRVAKELSGSYKPGIFKKSRDVYNNNDVTWTIHPGMEAKHIDKILNNPDSDQLEVIGALKHPGATAEHLTRGLSHSDRNIRRAVLSNPNLNPEHIQHALDNETDSHVHEAALKHPKITSEQIHNIIDNTNHHLHHRHINDVETLMDNPSVRPEHITKVLNLPDRNNDYSTAMAKAAAVRNPNASSENITHALSHDDSRISSVAIQHKNVRPEHIQTALTHRGDTPHYALQHPKATKEHIMGALNHDDWRVRDTAKEIATDQGYIDSGVHS